jgi:hypothetical protein
MIVMMMMVVMATIFDEVVMLRTKIIALELGLHIGDRRTMMIMMLAVVLDLHIGSSPDHDDCGGC